LWKNLKLQSQLENEYPIDKEETRNRNFKPSMIHNKEIEKGTLPRNHALPLIVATKKKKTVGK